MKYLITNKTDIGVDLKEGLNKVTGQELNTILNHAFLSEIASVDHSCYIKAGLVLRSTYTNEVLVWGENEIALKQSIKEDPRDLAGYFLVMTNVQAMLLEKVDIPLEAIKTSVLQPIGVIREGNDLTILFHLILQDKFLSTLTLKGVETQPIFENIEVVKNFTNLSEYTKMVIPTLKIVGSESVENKSDREQGL